MNRGWRTSEVARDKIARTIHGRTPFLEKHICSGKLVEFWKAYELMYGEVSHATLFPGNE